MSKFQSTVEKRGDGWHVRIAGVIDEDNQLGAVAEQISGGPTALELGDVERINSCGVRDWVKWLAAVEARTGPLVLRECSPAIVAQINLVNNFTGQSAVESFYAPYYCKQCDQEKVLLVNTADMKPGVTEPPTCRCDECDRIMEFDDMPDSYFAFLADPNKVGRAPGAVPVEASVKNRVRRHLTMPPPTPGAQGTPSSYTPGARTPSVMTPSRVTPSRPNPTPTTPPGLSAARQSPAALPTRSPTGTVSPPVVIAAPSFPLPYALGLGVVVVVLLGLLLYLLLS